MMMRSHNHILLLVVGLGTLLGACSETKNQEQPKTTKQEGPGKGGDTADVEDGADVVDTPGASDVFTSWCEKAGEIAPAKKDLKNLYAAFCVNGKPTALFTKSLIGIAYSGSGNPKLKEISPFENDKGAKTTTGYLGVGIKLPISIADHFNKVGPKGGDVASLKKLATAQGAVGEAEILEEYENDGKYHVRGWKVHSKSTKDLIVTKLITESDSRSDQFELTEDEAYAYTQITLEAQSGIKDFNMLTAGIKIGGTSYLITQAYIVADNKGLPSAAPGQIRDIARGLIKAMYTAAKDAK